MGVNVKTP